MRRRNKRVASLLLLTFLLTELSFLVGLELPKAHATTISTGNLWTDKNDPNKMYYVGLGYYDMWLASDGVTWTGDGHQPNNGERVSVHSYTFDFQHSTQNIVDVQASPFIKDSFGSDAKGSIGEQMFLKSRGYHYLDYEDYITENLDYSASRTNISGLGTKSVSGSASITNGWLTANNGMGEDRRAYEESKGQTFDPLVQGWRIYFPVLYTITLEPVTGTAHIRHFTTDGTSLDGVFHDRDETITKGQNYSYVHPTHPDYVYKGWEKSTISPPSGESLTKDPEDPYPLEPYDGSYSDYYAYFYYDPVEIELEYELDVQPSSWTMFVDDSKEFVALGRSRPAGTTDPWSPWGELSDSEVTWATASSSIATIDADGIALGRSTGTTTVRATWNSKGLTDTSQLIVDQEPQIEYDLSIDPEERTIIVGDTEEFEAIYRDREIGATDWSGWKDLRDSEVTWSIDDPEIAAIDSGGEVTGIEGGTTDVRVEWVTDEGDTHTANADLKVVPPNPVPVIIGPSQVKENRPLPFPFSSANSYSPVPGRTIDHSRDEWTNKQEKYTTPGTFEVELHVFDNTGMKSLRPDRHTLTVLPDEPPVAKGEIVPLGLRNKTYTFYNKSYSPDGDIIASTEYKVRYDSNNNGFSDDAWQPLAGDKAKATLIPSKVGKYQFYLKVCEDYGKCDDTLSEPIEITVLDVLNQAPTVSFTLEGSNPQINDNLLTVFSPKSIYDNWTLYDTFSTKTLNTKHMNWTVDGALSSGLGRKFEHAYYSENDDNELYIYPLRDSGFGQSGLSPWRAMQAPDATYTQPLLMPSENESGWTFIREMERYFTNRTHFFFEADNTFYAFNKSKIGRHAFQEPYDDALRQHYYLDGSPYDYILQRDNVPKYYAKAKDYGEFNTPWEFSTTQQNGYRQLSVTDADYYVAGSTIYQDVTFRCNDCYYDGDDWYYYTFYGTFTYDLQNPGIVISEDISPEQGLISNAMQVFSRGNNLLSLHRSSKFHVHKDVTTYAIKEIDPDLEVVATYEIPYAGSWSVIGGDYNLTEVTLDPGMVLEDVDGSLYYYETIVERRYEDDDGRLVPRTPSSVKKGVNLVKLNPDFSLAWRTTLQGEGPSSGESTDGPNIILNPIKKEILVKSWNYQGTWQDNDDGYYYTKLNADSGAVIQSVRSNTSSYIDGFITFRRDGSSFYIDWNGNYRQFNGTGHTTVVTQDGIVTDGPPGNTVGVILTDADKTYDRYRTGGSVGGAYIGDGLFLSFNTTKQDDIDWENVLTPVLVYGTPTTNAVARKPFSSGQFLSGFNVGNAEITFTMSLEDANGDTDMAGMAFRAVNPIHKYAVETDGSKLYLSKYINGARTVLKQSNYPFQDGVPVTIQIRALGTQLDVYVEGVKYLSATDSSFMSGKIGPFTDKSYVHFGTVTTKAIAVPEIVWDSEYAIWDEGSARAEVRYSNITYTDPEFDPVSESYQWRYAHTPKFINNQGVSALHNKTYSAHQLYFDKVGIYDVYMSAKDDPHPSYRYPSNVFDDYREPSNEFGKRITVHRRPVAKLQMSFNADNTVKYTDTSFDPDRYESPSKYSASEDGKNYLTTRGVFDRKYYYVSPSGRYVESQLFFPSEYGTYMVGLSVMDEYGAWSEWTVRSIHVTNPFPPNTPPVVTMTYPTGTQTAPTITGDLTPTLSWGQTDADPGTVFKKYHLQVTNEANTSYIMDTGERAQNTTLTTASFTPTSNLPAGQKMRVRARVNDGIEWGVWSAQTWLLINRAPTATLTFPTGTQASPTPTTKRPTIRWNQTDPDTGTIFNRYQVEIINEANTLVVQTSGEAPQNTRSTIASWTVPTDLPNGKYQVRVRVNDGYVWSAWSTVRWMVTNRAPTADFTWSPTLIYEGDNLTLTNTSTDPDGDTLTYVWTITKLNGTTETRTTTNVTLNDVVKGTYTVKLRATDPSGSFDEVTKNITVQDLTIAGQVAHTTEWEAYRQSWNNKFPDEVRAVTDFWAGEAIVLSANVTNTATSTTKPQTVTALLVATGDTETLSSTNKVNYSGTMIELDHSKVLTDGPYVMRFTVTWTNGHVEINDVPFNVRGDIHDVIVGQLRL